MKPSLLKINGLNSFSQTEIIDFDKLTSRGLFGIFGPTGSGKSTILDAITLALYGEVARKTKSYINSDLDTAYIYFEFFSGHGDNKKKHIIERTIKRTKTGTQTAKIKLEIYDKFNELVDLIENRTPVEKELSENIIKLNFDDFIRTVVLPQGKFSEFLTLTGAERNHMLERILGLEEYGKALTTKINSKKGITNDKLNYLNGELARFDDSSEDNIEDIKKEQEEVLEEEKKLIKKISALEKEHKKYSEIHSLGEELEGYIKTQKELDEKQDDISEKEIKLQNGKSALNIYPYIENFEKGLKDQKENNEKLKKLDIELKNIESEIKTINSDYKKAYKLKENENPKLIKKEISIDNAIDLENENKETKQILQDEEKQFEEYKKHSESLEEELEGVKEDTEEIEKKIEDIEKKMKKKTISSVYKSRLVEGKDIETRYEKLVKDIELSEENYNEINKRIKDEKVKIDKLDSKLKELNDKLDKNKLIYIDLKKILLLKEQLLKETTKDIEKLKEQSFAKILAGNLDDKSPCPVCGSTKHPDLAKDIDNSDLKDKEKIIDKLDKEIQTLKSELNVILSLFSYAGLDLKDLETIIDKKDNLKNKSVNDLWKEKSKTLKENLEKIKAEKDEINEKHIRNTTLLESTEENLEQTSKKKLKLEKEKSELLDEYEDIKKILEVKDIAKKYNEVTKVEEELEKLNEKLTTERSKLKEIQDLTMNLDKKFNQDNDKLKELKYSIDNKKETIDKNTKKISSIVGNEKPDKLKVDTQKAIDKLTHNEKSLKDKLEELKEKDYNLKNQKINIEESEKKLELTLKDTKSVIDKLVVDYKFTSIEQVKASSIEQDTIENLEKEIRNHQKLKENIESNIIRVKKLLNDESITKESLDELETKKTQMLKDQQSLLEKKGKIEEKLNEMNKSIKRVKEIKKELKKLELRKDSLDEIYKITKGKKFVEFVSRNHLDYIARAATEQLKEITRGRYGLILNDENSFEVIDNHNGGVRRDCSSLSGGETFLTSLALALALSTKIQLKGDTSMEFFFLDEGFGTLDVETLDTAMTALENLHTENLSVGIISHVEEIKNRVPIKLMVSSPEPGVSGSKVKIVKT